MKTCKVNIKAILFIPINYLLFDETCLGENLQRCKGKFTINRIASISIFVETIKV